MNILRLGISLLHITHFLECYLDWLSMLKLICEIWWLHWWLEFLRRCLLRWPYIGRSSYSDVKICALLGWILFYTSRSLQISHPIDILHDLVISVFCLLLIPSSWFNILERLLALMFKIEVNSIGDKFRRLRVLVVKARYLIQLVLTSLVDLCIDVRLAWHLSDSKRYSSIRVPWVVQRFGN